MEWLGWAFAAATALLLTIFIFLYLHQKQQAQQTIQPHLRYRKWQQPRQSPHTLHDPRVNMVGIPGAKARKCPGRKLKYCCQKQQGDSCCYKILTAISLILFHESLLKCVPQILSNNSMFLL